MVRHTKALQKTKKCPWCRKQLFWTHDGYLVCSGTCRYWERIK